MSETNGRLSVAEARGMRTAGKEVGAANVNFFWFLPNNLVLHKQYDINKGKKKKK